MMMGSALSMCGGIVWLIRKADPQRGIDTGDTTP